jgi:hypothetical protein
MKLKQTELALPGFDDREKAAEIIARLARLQQLRDDFNVRMELRSGGKRGWC